MPLWAFIVLVLGFFCAVPARAQTLHGHVISVNAGDNIILLDASGRQRQIQLVAIAAPEPGQPYFARSRDKLARWTLRRDVTFEQRTRGANDRLNGTVFVDGHDVNLEQVRAGLAWWDRRAANQQSGEERDVYEQAEHAARYRKLGLWADRDPVPPWEWRARHAPAGTR